MGLVPDEFFYDEVGYKGDDQLERFLSGASPSTIFLPDEVGSTNGSNYDVSLRALWVLDGNEPNMGDSCLVQLIMGQMSLPHSQSLQAHRSRYTG